MSDNDDLKKQLEAIQNQLTEMRIEILKQGISMNKANIALLNTVVEDSKLSVIESKMSDFTLYYSIYFSALIGIIGNWFVSLWFQPATEEIVSSLMVSGFFLIVIIAFVMIEIIRSYRRIKRL